MDSLYKKLGLARNYLCKTSRVSDGEGTNLCEFELIGAIHSVSTPSMSHYMYIEWMCKLEI